MEHIKGLFGFLKSRSFLIQIGVAVVLLFLFIFILKWWLGMTTNHGQKIQVPNLDKLGIEEVETRLETLDLQFVVIDSANYNPDYPNKSVIEQDPEAGDFVKENRKIYLTLNPSKYRDIEIPDLNGKTKRLATSILLSTGFLVGDDITFVKDKGKDVVRGLKHHGEELQPGTKLPKQSTINFILGDGN